MREGEGEGWGGRRPILVTISSFGGLGRQEAYPCHNIKFWVPLRVEVLERQIGLQGGPCVSVHLCSLIITIE